MALQYGRSSATRSIDNAGILIQLWVVNKVFILHVRIGKMSTHDEKNDQWRDHLSLFSLPPPFGFDTKPVVLI